MPLKRSIMADLPEIPPQNATIDAYITEVKDKIAWVEEQQSKGLRTTDYTLTDFSETKRDRMWKMKQTGEMTDTILITSDGQSEVSAPACCVYHSILHNCFSRFLTVCTHGHHAEARCKGGVLWQRKGQQ